MKLMPMISLFSALEKASIIAGRIPEGESDGTAVAFAEEIQDQIQEWMAEIELHLDEEIGDGSTRNNSVDPNIWRSWMRAKAGVK